MDILKTLAAELNIKVSQAKAAVELIDEGNTIPPATARRPPVRWTTACCATCLTA